MAITFRETDLKSVLWFIIRGEKIRVFFIQIYIFLRWAYISITNELY